MVISCLNFWDEAGWFLSLRVFWLSLFPQRFSWYVLRPSSGVCRTREPSWNLKLMSFIESTGVACSASHNRVQVLSIPVLLLTYSQDWTCNLQMIRSLGNQHLYMPCVLLDNSEWIFGTYKLIVLTWQELLLLCMIFYLCSYSDLKKIFFILPS